MFRTTVFASLIALGAVGAAQAQDNGPRLGVVALMVAPKLSM